MSTVQTSIQEGTLVVCLNAGKSIPEDNARDVGNTLHNQVANAVNGRMLLDLEGVEFFTSAMIGQLIWLEKKCSSENVRLIVCNIHPNLKQILDVVNIGHIVEIAETPTHAQLAFAHEPNASGSQHQASDFESDAESGRPEAQFELARCYDDGRGVPQSAEQAFTWYGKAAEGGLADAQYALGRSYAFGIHVPCDYGKAIEWYEKAANQGHADAQYILGVIHRWGIGVDEDQGRAVEWYRRASDEGHPAAAQALSEMQ